MTNTIDNAEQAEKEALNDECNALALELTQKLMASKGEDPEKLKGFTLAIVYEDAEGAGYLGITKSQDMGKIDLAKKIIQGAVSAAVQVMAQYHQFLTPEGIIALAEQIKNEQAAENGEEA